MVAYVLAYAVAATLAMLPVLLHHDLPAFWDDTISYQSSRGSPFSVWGLWGGLGLAQHLLQGAAAALALAVVFVPRRRGLTELAALGAAVLIAVQLGISHWFYLYIPWFFPLVMLALLLAHPRGAETQGRGGSRLEQDRPPALAGAS
jgi:peptidoglycan/LPS O-acetylase OafA/YrhL